MIHRCCAFVERGPDCEMWQQRVSNSYACSGRTQNRRVDKVRRMEDRRRHVTRYHENMRVIVEVKSECGGRLARSWSRSTYPYAGWDCDAVIGIQSTPCLR
jgi:hypothetical protein